MPERENDNRLISFFKKVLNKKLTIFCTLLILALAGGLFYFRFIRLTPPEKWDEASYSPAEDYKVVEIGDTRRIVNKKAGISFDVPDGWTVQEKNNSVFVLSPDFDQDSPPPNMKGCLISPSVIYKKTNLSVLEEPLDSLVQAYITQKNIVQIDGRESIRYKSEIEETNLYKEGVATPVNKLFKSRLLVLNVESSLADKDRCSEKFEDFIKTVSID